MKYNYALTLVISTIVSINARNPSNRRLQTIEDGKLFFSVTYRDFMNVDCLLEADGKDILARGYNLDVVTQTPGGSCDLIADSVNGDQDWIDAMKAGEILGHPDFQRDAFGGISSHCNDGLPLGECKNSVANAPMLLGDIDKTATSGVPKPQYCLPDDDDFCGTDRDEARTQSNKEFFDSWYNDNNVFNRRVGMRLAFKDVGNDLFKYSSTTDDDAPDFEDLTDGGGDDVGNINVFFGPLRRFKLGGRPERVDIEDVSREEIINVPAWPQNFAADQGFYMTAELHTTFEFLEAGNMVFTFSGDDDFWAYINGIKIIDLQGVHARVDRTINLNSIVQGESVKDFLKLTNGEVYTLDLFHAERQRGQSNFEAETSLAAACNVIQSGSVVFDFTEPETLDLVEDFVATGVSVDDGVIKLISGDRAFQANSFYTSEIQNLEPGFIATFTVSAGNQPDGFAFVVQANGVVDLPVSTQDFNFGGLTNSFAILFDLCKDRNDANPTCDDKEISLHFPDNFNDQNNAEDNTRKVFDKYSQRHFERNEDLLVEIIYFGGRPDFLEVYIDNSLYLRQDGFFFADVVGNGGGHVGFTATSSFVNGDIDIKDFTLELVLEEKSDTQLGFNINDIVPVEVDADGETPSEGFDFQLFDFCGNRVNSGGLAGEFNVIFTDISNGNEEEGRRLQQVVDVPIVDNNDGSYSAVLITDIPGNYSMRVEFGDCENGVQDGDEEVDCFIFDSQGQVLAIANELDVNETGDIDLNNEEGLNPLPFVGGAGGVCCLGVILAIVFVKYKRDWDRKKKFIAQGIEFERDNNTTFAGGDQYTAAGKAYVQTQMEISALKAKANHDGREDEIGALERENQEMEAQLKETKQKNAIDGVTREQTFASKKKRLRKQEDF